MAAGELPSFHEAYVQVLAQLDTLKRVHALQLASEPQSNLLSTSAHPAGPDSEGEACNGGSLPAAQNAMNLVVEMNEHNHHHNNNSDNIEDERSIRAKEGTKKDRKRRSSNSPSDDDVAESNAPAVQRDGHKKAKSGAARGGAFQNFDLNEAIRQPPGINALETTGEDEEAVMVSGDRKSRHSSRAELKKNGLRQQESREEVFKELEEALAGYVKPEGLDPSGADNIAARLGSRVREVFESLESEKMKTLGLRDSVIQKEQENKKLRRENEELQQKLADALSSSSLPHESLCKACKSTVRATVKTELTPISTQNLQTTELLPDAGEEVAAEVIRSLSMTPNHRAIASTSAQERIRAAADDAAKPPLGLQLKKADAPQPQDGNAATPLSSKWKGLAMAGSAGLHGKLMSDKRLCEFGRELAKRAGGTEQLPPLLQVKRLLQKQKLGGGGGEDFSESDTESVVKRVIRTDKRPWVITKAGPPRSFPSSLDSISEWARNEHAEDDATLKELKRRTQSPGFDASEAMRSVRFMGQDDDAADPTYDEKDDYSMDLMAMDEKHDFEDRNLDDEGEEKPRPGTGIYKEYLCGVTTKGGDTTGVLRVYESGVFQVFCHCPETACTGGVAMTPWDFERHGGRGSSKKWRDSIWVKQAAQRVPVSRVKELETYIHRNNSRKDGKKLRVSAAETAEGPKTHRDEFVTCAKCMKQRRFHRRNVPECRAYHDAVNNPNWECADFPDNKYPTCDEEEEREVRRAQRGCARSRYCLGCVHCLCSGCAACRFPECNCPSCVESRSLSREPGCEVATQTSLTKSQSSPVSLPIAASKNM